MTHYCLGLEVLGECAYDPALPAWRIISLGDTITAIALVIAFSQLLTLTLKCRINRIFPRVYLLWGIAVASIVTSSLLPIFPGKAQPLIGYPIFWELIGAGFVVGSIVWLLLAFNSRLKFRKNTALSIMNLVVRVIGTGEGKDYVELAVLLRGIVKDLVRHVSAHDSIKAEISRRNGETYEIPPLAVNAGRIFQICSDQAFCAAIVKKDPGFAITLFEEIKTQRAYGNGLLKPLVWELVRQSLLQSDSILYREEKFRGLGFVHGFTKSAFSSAEFNERVQPLSGIHLVLEKSVSIEMIERYGEILIELVEAYLKAGDFYQHSFSLYSAVGELMSYAGTVASRLDLAPPDDLYRSDSFQLLRSIAKTLAEIIKKFSENKDILDENLIAHFKGVEENQDHSAFKYVATWVFELLKALSRTRKYDQQLRDISIDPWMALYHPMSGSSLFHQEVQWRLEEMLFDQLKINLEEGYYPAVTRPLIWLLGLHENIPQEDAGAARFRKEFFEYVRKTFRPLHQLDADRALDKLPVGVMYKVETQQLIQHVRKGDERILQL